MVKCGNVERKELEFISLPTSRSGEFWNQDKIQKMGGNAWSAQEEKSFHEATGTETSSSPLHLWAVSNILVFPRNSYHCTWRFGAGDARSQTSRGVFSRTVFLHGFALVFVLWRPECLDRLGKSGLRFADDPAVGAGWVIEVSSGEKSDL